MKHLSDDQIFDILDGMADSETQQKHQDLWQSSVEYRRHFEEIQALHLQLSSLSVEEPSAEFTKNVLGQVAFKQATDWSIQWIWGLGLTCLGFMILMVALLSQPTLRADYQLIKISSFYQYFAQAIVAVNAILLLLLLDKKFLKPYFENRIMSYNGV
jgi:hypothetical protein